MRRSEDIDATESAEVRSFKGLLDHLQTEHPDTVVPVGTIVQDLPNVLDELHEEQHRTGAGSKQNGTWVDLHMSGERAESVCWAIREWLPGQAQHVLDLANETIATDPDWPWEDDFAGKCEQLALAARALADIDQTLARSQRGAGVDGD